MTKKNHRFMKPAGIFLVVVLLLVSLELLHSKYALEVTHYELNMSERMGKPLQLTEDAAASSLRILQLTDLHDASFGQDNEKLIAAVAEEQPDVIFITGDLVDSHKWSDTLLAQALIPKLVDIAPVYISLGNQEKDLMDQAHCDVIGDYEKCGATVLDYSYVDVEIKGRKYRIGGIYGYCQPVAHAMETHRDNETAFLMDFQDTDACKLLLCHMPVCWVASYSLYDWDVDVVFSGHSHGGQVRIPYIGGLWAPDQGWFPGEMCGIYTTSQEGWELSRKKLLEFAKQMKYDTTYYQEHDVYRPSYLVLSRGLGNTDWVPRFNNVPEIAVVDLYPHFVH